MDNGLTFQDIYKLAQNFAQDTNTTAQDSATDPLTFLKQQINTGLRIMYREIGGLYNEKSKTYSTSTSSNEYDLPADCSSPKTLYVIDNNRRYLAGRVYDRDEWIRLLADNNTVSSNFLTKWFVKRSSFEIWPKASTAANSLILEYESSPHDLSADDYTEGTITTLASNGTTVTANSSTFTSAMAGRFFKVNSDGQWYEIESVDSTTQLTLVKGYEGTAISAGSEAYTIGEMPRLPGATHHIPALYAAWKYFAFFRRNSEKAKMFEGDFKQDLAWAKNEFNKPYESTYIPPNHTRLLGVQVRDPNLWPESLS